MYFDAAESKITDIEARVATLETATPVQAQIDALTATIATLDARLDAIATGAEG